MCPGNEPALLVLHYLKAPQVHSCCGASWRVTWWVTGRVVRCRQGLLQRLTASSLQTSAANFQLDAGVCLSRSGIALFCKASYSHAVQRKEVRVHVDELRKLCWMARAGLAAYRCIFIYKGRQKNIMIWLSTHIPTASVTTTERRN